MTSARRLHFASLGLLSLAAVLVLAACTPDPPPPPPEPIAMGEAATIGSVEIRILAFEVGSPDFVDTNSRAGILPIGGDRMATIRLEFRNVGGSPVTYAPQHAASSESTPQLSNMPNDAGERTFVERIVAPQNFASVGQLSNPTEIAANAALVDDYHFRVPPADFESLLLIIPGNLVGAKAEETAYFALPNKPTPSPAAAPGTLNQPYTKGPLKVTITSVKDEFVEAVKVGGKETSLKYPYAYTIEPILKISYEFENTGTSPIVYAPGHRAADSQGVMLSMIGTNPVPLARYKLADANAQAKDQIKKTPFELKPGEKQKDSFLFQRPPSSGKLELVVSGHVYGVKGLLRFQLDYTQTDPPKPDLEPYKKEIPVEPVPN